MSDAFKKSTNINIHRASAHHEPAAIHHNLTEMLDDMDLLYSNDD